MRICYEEQWFSYDACRLTAADILVLAWRREASLQMEPLTSGFRTILSFTLVSTSSDPKPPLPLQPETLLRMHDTFSTWQQVRRQTAPSKIVRLLGSKYNQANVRRSILRGPDTHFVSILAEFARMYSFKIGLAVLACRLRGERVYYGSEASDDGDEDSDQVLDEAEEDSDDSRSTSSDQGAEDDIDRYKKKLRKRYPPPSEKVVSLVDLDGAVLQGQVHCGDDTRLYPDILQRTLSSRSNEVGLSFACFDVYPRTHQF